MNQMLLDRSTLNDSAYITKSIVLKYDLVEMNDFIKLLLFDVTHSEFAAHILHLQSSEFGLSPSPNSSSLTNFGYIAENAFRLGTALATLINNSIKAGKLESPTTLHNWITWAESKGYSTAHLTLDKAVNASVKITETKAESNVFTDNDLIDKKTLASLLGISENTVDRHIKKGLIPPKDSIGKAVKWRYATIKHLLKTQQKNNL